MVISLVTDETLIHGAACHFIDLAERSFGYFERASSLYGAKEIAFT